MSRNNTVANSMAKNTFTKRHIVGIMAFVRITGTIAASFPSDLAARAILAKALPAGYAPFLVHGAINHL
jgi:hypothetical protein